MSYFDTDFNISFVNIRGLCSNNSANFRQSKFNSKLIEFLHATTNPNPTFFSLLETHLKLNSKKIKFPSQIKYASQTNFDGKAGIICFHDRKLEIENRNDHIKIICPGYAIYNRVKIGSCFLNNIILYMPTTIREFTSVLNKVELFLEINQITQFCIYGDCNFSFDKELHRSRALKFKKFMQKFQLFDLDEKLNSTTDFTWYGAGQRSGQTSKIDHFFTNINCFTGINYKFFSASDHKILTVSHKKAFIYRAPSWKNHLFRNNDFREMFKKQSITYLFECADSPSKLQNLDYYLQNSTTIADNDFSFMNTDHCEATVLFNLIDHLKKHHDKFLSKQRLFNFHKTEKFDKEISKLFHILAINPNDDTKAHIKNIVSTQQQYFKELVYTQAETNYFRKLQYDGLSNKYTFKHIPKNWRIQYNLSDNGSINNDPQFVANTFGILHSKIVNPPTQPISTLNELLHDYNLSLNDIFPQLPNVNSPFSTTKEFKTVLKSMKANSSPGISTQTKVLFEFLLDLFPNFTTRAFNYLYTIDIDNSPFSWIKERNIIFIPKKDCDLTDPSNFRPISLLEVIYKILSKALNEKVTPHLPTIVSPNQFGFMKKRQMSNATMSIVSVINHAISQNDDIQLISFDFSKAFDKTLPDVTNSILRHIFPEGQLASSIIKLTNGGRFRAIINGSFSNFFDINIGSGQGDPYSSTKFLPLNHIFVACLNSPRFQSITYKVNDQYIKTGSFADDNWSFMQIKTNGDVNELKSLLLKLQQSIGLEINFSKTKILVRGNFPESLNLIGKICEKFKHLGVFISFDHKLASKTTYTYLMEKLEKKAKEIPLKYGYNLFKRRNLCSSLLNSMCYPVYRIYTPNEDECKKIWKIINKFLWSKQTKDNGITYQFKISQKRIELPFSSGGLNFLKPVNQSFSVWLASFFNVLIHANNFPSSNLGIILSYLNVPLKKILSNFGFKSVIENQRALKQIYPLQARNNLETLCTFFYNIEREPEYFFQTPILQSNWSNIALSFSNTDFAFLKKHKKLTFASLFKSSSIGNKIFFMPNISDDLKELLNVKQRTTMLPKLEQLIEASKDFFPYNLNFNKSKLKHLKVPISSKLITNPSIFSFHFKKLHKKSLAIEPPSIATRQRDQIYFPDKELFFISFNKIFSLPIILHYKNFFFEQFLRVLPSRNKLFKFNHIENPNCLKCLNTICTTEHSIFQCIFPRYFVHSLAIFLDFYFNDSKPQFIFLKENFYLFNMFYEEFSTKEYLQITHLILIAKDKSLKISYDDCIKRWTHLNYYSQSLLIVQFTRKLLLNAGFDIDLITSFSNFLLNNQDLLEQSCP
jgi:hypothetical protein